MPKSLIIDKFTLNNIKTDSKLLKLAYNEYNKIHTLIIIKKNIFYQTFFSRTLTVIKNKNYLKN